MARLFVWWVVQLIGCNNCSCNDNMKTNVLLLGWTKSVIHFTERTTEVMEREQNKRQRKSRFFFGTVGFCFVGL